MTACVLTHRFLSGQWCYRIRMALGLLCSPHPDWFLLRAKPGSGCAQRVRRLLSYRQHFCFFPQTNTKYFLLLTSSSHISESLPKREKRQGRVESFRSCESVSSWMKTCTATWSGSLMLKSWMPIARAKVSTCEPAQLPSHAATLSNSNSSSLSFLSGLLPLTNGDSDADSLYDLEGKSPVIYY